MRKNAALFLVLIALCIVFVCTACRQTVGKAEKLDEKASLTLSLYCLESNYNADQYITEFEKKFGNITVQKTAFESAEMLDERVANELNSGSGPDMVIFSAGSKLDVVQMARNGAFAPLDAYLEHSEKAIQYENYIASAFDAGKVKDVQYVVPISVALSFLQYNPENISGFEPAPVITFRDFMTAFYEGVETYEDDPQNGALMGYGLIPYLLESSQIINYTNDDRTVTYDQEELRKFVEFLRDVSTEEIKSKEVVAKYGDSLVDFTKHFRYTYQNSWDFIYMARSVNSVNKTLFGNEAGISVLTGVNSDSVAAMLSSYGVVNKNAGEKAGYACEFLRLAMDAYPQSGYQVTNNLSVNKFNIYEQILTYKSTYNPGVYDGLTINREGFSDALATHLTAIVDRIDRVQVFNFKAFDIFLESFTPYIEGTSEYESCQKDFDQRINLYLTE